MEILTLSDKEALIAHRSQILDLFTECFSAVLPPEVWKWAYIDNPAGDPVVSLCYDEGRLVAHYAVIPMPIASCSTLFKSYLSMTTMVAKSHRKHGLFVKLAGHVYEHLRQHGEDFVFGFPNVQSAPGFAKRLQWVLPEPDFVASVSKEFLLQHVDELAIDWQQDSLAHLRDENLRTWRLGKPRMTYLWDQGLAFKAFGDALDLMYFDSPESLTHLPDGNQVNLIVPASAQSFRAFKLFDYQFGGVSINREFKPERVVRQMSLSDVF